MNYTLGSLFDGSGGFPLAGSMCGFTPLWAAEVEPYPIAVTRSRFPEMRHLGDISKINGAEIPPVDVITFGSPCQDLSVAGKRAGLKHEDNGDEETTRSGLFMEAVRIIKEMREATHGRYPTFALWENVPGAFSSNRGEDFRIVLEELIKIVESCATVPPAPKSGWPYADTYMGAGWSLAYRVFDAQYWGVPQRRRRIHLVVDFGGERAREILFEREGVRGYFAEGRTPWQGIADHAESGIGADDRERNGVIGTFQNTGIGWWNESPISATIRTPEGGDSLLANVVCEVAAGANGVVQPVAVMASSAVNAETTDGSISPCLMARAGTGGNQLPLVAVKTWDARGNGDGDICNTLTGDHAKRITDYTSVVCEPIPASHNGVVQPMSYSMQGFGDYKDCGVASGLKARDYKDATDLVVEDKPIVLDRAFYNQGQNAQYDPQFYTDGTVPTLVARGPSAVAVRYIVRRLTPTECARLQGFADRWGDIEEKTDFTDEEYRFWLDVRNTHAAINGKATKEYTKAQMLTWYNKLHTDSAEYKMWGNGIALPPALYCMQGIEDALEGGRRDG